MKAASPLRYPGGKASLAGLLRQVIALNRLGNRTLVEPFAGGAGASLTLLYSEDISEILINDADQAIFALWWSLLFMPTQFRRLLLKTPVTLTEWYRQRETYRSRRKASRLQRGFSAFYLNRCNRSGIIVDGGPIGGIEQDGRWLIDARFNKPELLRRCDKIAEYRDRIKVSDLDGLALMDDLDPKSTFYFLDPPYFEKGRMVYLNSLSADYHTALAGRLRRLNNTPWVLTYDDCPEIRSLYSDWATIRPFGLQYVAAQRRTGKEILIAPRWVQLPTTQKSAAITW
jgi:DNA adenine methylase